MDENTESVYVRNRRFLFPIEEPTPVNVVASAPPKNLIHTLKTKIMRKRIVITHPCMMFNTKVELKDEKARCPHTRCPGLRMMRQRCSKHSEGNPFTI